MRAAAIGIFGELADVPDEDLLVVPAEPDAGLVGRMEAVALFEQQALAHRLERMHDLRKSVVVVGRFDKQLVVITPGGGGTAVTGNRMAPNTLRGLPASSTGMRAA